MVDMLLDRPEKGQQITRKVAPGSRCIFTFSLNETTVERFGNDMVLTFDDGASLALSDFYDHDAAEKRPMNGTDAFVPEELFFSTEELLFDKVNTDDVFPSSAQSGMADSLFDPASGFEPWQGAGTSDSVMDDCDLDTMLARVAAAMGISVDDLTSESAFQLARQNSQAFNNAPPLCAEDVENAEAGMLPGYFGSAFFSDPTWDDSLEGDVNNLLSGLATGGEENGGVASLSPTAGDGSFGTGHAPFSGVHQVLVRNEATLQDDRVTAARNSVLKNGQN